MASLPQKKLQKKLAKVCLIVSDMDGVLTDGKIVMNDDAGETRHYNVQDGMGMKLAQEFGLEWVFISGKLSHASAKRLASLGVRHVYQDVEEKGRLLDSLLTERRMKHNQICAVGDDLADISMFNRSGVAIAVANAVNEVKAKAHWTTRKAGGDGALREIVDEILKAKGLWSRVLARFGA